MYIGMFALKKSAVYIAILYIGPAALFCSHFFIKTAAVYIPIFICRFGRCLYIHYHNRFTAAVYIAN